MYQVIWQEENKIEIALSDELTADEFQKVLHQLESLCSMYPNIHINALIDAVDVKKYEFKIITEEHEFYKKYKQHLGRIALVSDSLFQKFMHNIFGKFTKMEFKTFGSESIEDARKWIFPSKLPG